MLGKEGGVGDLNLLADRLRGDGNSLVQFASASAIGMIGGRLKKGESNTPLARDADEFAIRYMASDFPVMNALQAVAEFHEYANDAVSRASGAARDAIIERVEDLGDWSQNLQRIVTAVALHRQQPQMNFQTVMNLSQRVNTEHFESDPMLEELTQGVAGEYNSLLGRHVTAVDLQLSADAVDIKHKLGEKGVDLDPGEYVRKWSGKLGEAKALPPTGGNILSVYGASTDRVYTLTPENAGEFFKNAGITQLTRGELATIENPGGPGDPKNVREAAVAVLWAMRNGGDKSKVDAGAEEQLVSCMEKASIRQQDRAGGASANIANNLPREDGVTVWSQEVHETLTERGILGNNIRRLTLQEGGFTHNRALNKSADAEAALRLGHVIEFRPGVKIELPVEGGEPFSLTVYRMDRHIFGAPGQPGAATIKPYMNTKGGADVPDESIVEQIGRAFPVVFLNGMHYLKDDADNMRTTAQINALKKGGAFLHCPLSSVKAGKMDYLDVIRNTEGAGIDSIGMNEGEVGTVAAEVKRVLGLDDMQIAEGRSPQAVFENALAIARAMNTRVYVHGENFDVVIRRKGTDGELRDEVTGALYSKYAMIPKLLEGRADPDHPVYDNVKLEGLADMVDCAVHIRDNYTRPDGKQIDVRDLLWRGYTLGGIRSKEGGWGVDERWMAAMIPAKHIYRQDRILYPTGAGDCAEANDTVYALSSKLH